eukprot:363747-Chlamydomonas_euryale.AAC.11
MSGCKQQISILPKVQCNDSENSHKGNEGQGQAWLMAGHGPWRGMAHGREWLVAGAPPGSQPQPISCTTHLRHPTPARCRHPADCGHPAGAS